PPMALNALAVDPNDPNTVFAGTYGAGLYVSRDGGQTWMPSNAGLGKGIVGLIVIDPNDSNMMYTASQQGGVYKSTDGGRTWQAANRGINLDTSWNWTGLIHLDPADSRHLYYSAANGLYSSNDGGATWQQRASDCPWSITGLVIDPGNGEHVYASVYGPPGSTCQAGVYESRDGGRTWKQLTSAEMVHPQTAGWEDDWWRVAADPRDLDTLYAGGHGGVYKTSDGGKTWKPVLEQDCNWLAVNPADGAVYCGSQPLQVSRDGGASWSSPDFGPGSGGQDRVPFAIAPSDPRVVYAGDNAVMRSTDGGETWSGIGWLGAAAHMRLTVDPRDGNQLFLINSGMYVHGGFRSGDGGKTWQNAFSHVTGDGRLTMHPTQDVVYYASHWEGRLYRSNDNGQTWEPFGSGDVTGPWQVVPDPHDQAKLWLASDAGPAISKDGGETFARVESFPAPGNQPILLVYEDGQRMYVVNADGGLYRSDDAGETWRTLGTVGGYYYAAALDPSNPDVMYIGSTHKGVLKTENGGMGWRQVNTGLTGRSINELAIDPADPQTVYAATDSGAFISTDGGAQWALIQDGLGPNPIVYSIAVDPNDSSKAYAATPDGIFRLAGAPLEATPLSP
ncbi:MAG TPA: hypothetical protein VIK33_09240, partial [Anaerolineae bacterium]